ncbi:MAG TPA: hypothetical protein VK574_03700 [Terracidiphilus sp.]|nr:hypothetical protein [Terracidiphilus sp.]
MLGKQINQGQSLVGIFWLIGDRLILDTSPLSEAEPYGDCLGHRTSHIDYWTAQQGLGTVSREIEYEEPPRGRVVFNTRTQRFALYADRCILKRQAVVERIMDTMHLPTSHTNIGTDGHYKCSKCLESSCACKDDF